MHHYNKSHYGVSRYRPIQIPRSYSWPGFLLAWALLLEELCAVSYRDLLGSQGQAGLHRGFFACYDVWLSMAYTA